MARSSHDRSLDVIGHNLSTEYVRESVKISRDLEDSIKLFAECCA